VNSAAGSPNQSKGSDGASFKPGIEAELEQTLRVHEHEREAAEILDLAAESEA